MPAQPPAAVAPPAGPRIKSRPPTGEIGYPLILLSGDEKAGKSLALAVLSRSERVGMCYWIDLGEGVADAYGALPGAKYEIVDHDGSYREILEQTTAIWHEAARAVTAGEPPVGLFVDSTSAEWTMLVNWTNARARRSRAGVRALEQDPDAEIDPTSNLWNDANRRHYRLMNLWMTFPGVCVLTARGKEVAVMDPNGQPTKEKVRKPEGQKNLGHDVDAWIWMSRGESDPAKRQPRSSELLGVRSLRVSSGAALPTTKVGSWDVLDLDGFVFDMIGATAPKQDDALQPLRGDDLEGVLDLVATSPTSEDLKAVWDRYKAVVTPTDRETLLAAVNARLKTLAEIAAYVAEHNARPAEEDGAGEPTVADHRDHRAVRVPGDRGRQGHRRRHLLAPARRRVPAVAPHRLPPRRLGLPGDDRGSAYEKQQAQGRPTQAADGLADRRDRPQGPVDPHREGPRRLRPLARRPLDRNARARRLREPRRVPPGPRAGDTVADALAGGLLVTRLLTEAAKVVDARSARSRQRKVGASEIGVCRRRAAYSHHGHPVSDPHNVTGLPAIAGTWFHKGALDTMRREWGTLIETRVEDDLIRGHVDALDLPNELRVAAGLEEHPLAPDEPEVDDLKTRRDARMVDYVRNRGPKRGELFQVHLYADLLRRGAVKPIARQAGLAALGPLEVDTVRLRYLPRTGEEDSEYVHEQPFDPDVAAEAWSWVQQVAGSSSPEEVPRDQDGPGLSVACDHCPFVTACWGEASSHAPQAQLVVTDADLAATLAAYDEARTIVREAQADKDLARAKLDATRPAIYLPADGAEEGSS
jgi:hypothetical protein